MLDRKCKECGELASQFTVFGMDLGPLCDKCYRELRRRQADYIKAVMSETKKPENSLYAACVVRGIQRDNHESDLYIPVTKETTALVEQYGHKATIFTSQIDGKPWYDVPFAYLPWWEKRR